MKYIEDNYQNMVADLTSLVKYNSVYCEDGIKPFGKANRDVLDEALRLMKNKGFKTNNLDYYAGYGEIGKGDKLIGIVAHLDIVPAGEGWDSDPFKLTVKGDRLYGRGVSDDKGAAVASMYAMKYLLDSGYEFKKRVRLILGCNEETGSNCIKYYVSKEGNVDMGFTPDGEFPGIYAEKGMISATLSGKTRILDIKGGEASNIVCKKVVCVLPENSYSKEKFDAFMHKYHLKYDFIDNKVTVFGKAAHASMPDEGKNAFNYLMEALYYADFEDPFVTFFHKYIGLDLHGEKLGLDALKDEETNSSVNIGLVKIDKGQIEASIDIRFPITRKVNDIKQVLDKVNSNDCTLKVNYMIDPLYFDKKNPMIKALLKAYRSCTNDNRDMLAIGGGTYAKSMANIIAFGCAFNEEDNHIHDANESLKIDEFKKQVAIYIEAIKNLNEV